LQVSSKKQVATQNRFKVGVPAATRRRALGLKGGGGRKGSMRRPKKSGRNK